MLLLCGVGFGLALATFALTPALLPAGLLLLGCGAGATIAGALIVIGVTVAGFTIARHLRG